MNNGLVFTRQKVKNFQSLGDVEFPLDNPGLIGICGSNLDDPSAKDNGSGKSALLDSIPCTLFGRMPKYARPVNGKQIINKYSGSNTCELSTRFRLNGIGYIVTRQYTKSSHKLTLHQQSSEMARFIDISESSLPKTQEKIIQLIGSYQTFLNSIMFGKGIISRFVKADKVERGEIVASLVMDVESLETARRKIDLLFSKQKINLQDSEKWFLAAKQKVQTCKENWRQAQADYRDVKDNARNLPPEKPKHSSQELLKHRNKVSILQNKVKALQKLEIQAERCIAHRDGQIKDTKRFLAAITASNLSLCPICRSPLSGRVAEVAAADLQRRLESITSLQKQDQHYLKTLLSNREEMQCKLQDAISEWEDYRFQLKTETLCYKEAMQAVEVDQDRERVRVKKAKKVYDESKCQLERQKQLFQANRQVIKDMVFLRGAFSSKGIMAEVVKTICPKLTTLSQQYVQKFLGGGYDIRFVPQVVSYRGEEHLSFEVQASVKKGGENYAACSDGEQERIDVCVGLALRNLMASRFKHQINLLAFDERFAGMDILGGEKVMEIITDELKKQSCILIVSHQDHIQEMCHRIWTVKKQNGVATLITK